MRSFRLLGAGLALLVVAGCKHQETAETKAAPVASAAAHAAPGGPQSKGGSAQKANLLGDDLAGLAGAPQEEAKPLPPPTVTIVEPGAEPRAKLRYAFKADRSEQLVLDMKTGASREVDGKSIEDVTVPTIHVVLKLEPKSVSPEGAVSFLASVETVSLIPDPKADPEIVEGVKAQVDALRGLRAHATIDARGITTEAAIDALGSLQGDNQMTDQVVQTLRELAAPFPEEAVGRGAKWEKLTQLDPGATNITQKEQYTLTEQAGDHGKVKFAVDQVAPAQLLAGAGLPEGAKLESFVAKAAGTSAFDLTRIVPTSNLDGTTAITLAADEGATKHKLKMVMRLGVAVGGGVHK